MLLQANKIGQECTCGCSLGLFLVEPSSCNGNEEPVFALVERNQWVISSMSCYQHYMYMYMPPNAQIHVCVTHTLHVATDDICIT